MQLPVYSSICMNKDLPIIDIPVDNGCWINLKTIFDSQITIHPADHDRVFTDNIPPQNTGGIDHSGIFR